jgi:TIGR03009 family protein
MATAQLGTLLRHLHRLAAARDQQWTDRRLLDEFAARRDEAAFAALVARHGPMVLRVCRRVLQHEQDAEDAFQATFLVLARHTGAIRKRDALASWLHGVAYRTAMKAKRSVARRRNHEARLKTRRTDFQSVPPPTWDDVQAILDEEIQRLPDPYRAAFVLCILEGKSGPQAAAELAVQEGTVWSRLTRARRLLQQRLMRRGIQLAAVLAALAATESAGQAAFPAVLAQANIRSGLMGAAGESAVGAIPTHIAALAAGVTRAMFVSKAKIAAVVLVVLGALTATTEAWILATDGRSQPEQAATRSVAQNQGSQTPAKVKSSQTEKPDPPPLMLDPDDPLDLALLRWQKALDKIETASCQVSRTNKNNTLEYEDVFEGTFKYMKPNRWVLELRRKDKPEESEKWARDGKLLYQCAPASKEIMEYDLRPDHPARKENLAEDLGFGFLFNLINLHQLIYDSALGFLLGMKAEDAKRNYALSITKGKEKDPYYTYIDIKPRRKRDQADFREARLVLNNESYLPRQFWFRHPNGDETTWDIPKIEIGVKLTGDEFKLVVPEGWKVRRLPRATKDAGPQKPKDK